MIQTTNYKLNKIELVDSPADITVLNVNWDKIDTELNNLSNNKFDKSGGTISGAVTVNGTLTTNSLVNIGEYKLKVDITKGQTPIEAKYATIGIYDNSLSEGYRLGRIQYGISTNNTASMAMYVNRPNDAESEDSCGLLAQWLNGTTARISVTHHPETASSDKSVATTYWVRNLKATASQYGLVKLADETAILNESNESALTVDKAYEINDFRRMETAYSVGDKVNCTFNFGLFLECTTAGTTSAGTLDTRNVTHAQVITDGTCQWTVRTHVKSVNGNVPDANGNIKVKNLTSTEIFANTDLNDIKEIGEYFCYMDPTATSLLNCPTQYAFTLTVRKGTILQQELRNWLGYGVWRRSYYDWGNGNVGWTNWISEEQNIKGVVLAAFFPVGSIYMSADANFNPNTSWGGTWQKIENRFLLGSGSKAVGATGGEENVTLTEAQMPAHSHARNTLDFSGELYGIRTVFPFLDQNPSSGTFSSEPYDPDRTAQYATNASDGNGINAYNFSFLASRNTWGEVAWSGGGQAHNNMPPYEVVTIWKRVG